MQATATNIRNARWNSFGAEDGERLTGPAFKTRQAQVAAIAEAIVREGSPELHSDSTALCSHFKLRKGRVEADYVEAQVYTHAAGVVIRFWVYAEDFSVRVRDLVLLTTGGDKGYDIWLDTRADKDGRIFPHSGKYLFPGLTIMCNVMKGL